MTNFWSSSSRTQVAAAIIIGLCSPEISSPKNGWSASCNGAYSSNDNDTAMINIYSRPVCQCLLGDICTKKFQWNKLRSWSESTQEAVVRSEKHSGKVTHCQPWLCLPELKRPSIVKAVKSLGRFMGGGVKTWMLKMLEMWTDFGSSRQRCLFDFSWVCQPCFTIYLYMSGFQSIVCFTPPSEMHWL